MGVGGVVIGAREYRDGLLSAVNVSWGLHVAPTMLHGLFSQLYWIIVSNITKMFRR